MNSTRNSIFSIIVPVYNVEKYVEKCLESISSQTLKDIEVIVVDDGSTDDSLSVCNKFAETHENVRVYTKNNEGQGVARNYGVERAQGEFICFVDSDDWIEPGLCAEMQEILERSNADFINFGIDFVNNSGKVVKKINRFEVNELAGDEIFYRALLDDQVLSTPCNKIYRRNFLIDNGIWFPSLRVNEDVYYSRAVSRASSKTVFVSKVYYHALVRPGSTTRNMSLATFLATENLIQIERQHFFCNEKDQLFEQVFNAHVAKLFSYLLIQAAFRLTKYAEYITCFDVARRCRFFEFSSNNDVMRLLNSKNKLMVKLCYYPAILRLIVFVLKRVRIFPY